MSDQPKTPPDHEVWKQSIAAARKEVPEIKCDLPAIRKVLRESRNRHTIKVRSYLP